MKNIDIEVWKDIKGYEGQYQVSNLGRVKSLPNSHHKKEIIMKPSKDGNGYLFLHLKKNGKRKMYKVHRLVAEAFIPNPNNLPEINHKSEEKWLNTVENLEYCDSGYNSNYGSRNKRISIKLTNGKTSKPVKQMSLDGTLIAVWPSISETQRNGFAISAISACCRGKRKTHLGYRWVYA